jgi:predicted transposase/invertase (TIGR01784 family)
MREHSKDKSRLEDILKIYKKAIETAKKLKRMGLTVEQIMKATDLSEKEIEKI